jgi:Uma2 family endonuclease
MSSVLAPSPPETIRLPESEQLFEVVDGVRVEKPVSAASIWIASRLNSRLDIFVTEHELGTSVTEMIFILDAERDLRRRPDVAFVAAAKWPVGKMPPTQSDRAVIPDLAVEVISPNNRFTDVIRKLHEYFDYGVSEVWLVTPEERLVQIYHTPDEMTSRRAGEDLQTELVPGWSMPVSTLIPEMADAPSTTSE